MRTCVCVSCLLTKKINIDELCMNSKKDVVIVCLLFVNMSNAKILWQTIGSSMYEKCNPHITTTFLICFSLLIFVRHFCNKLSTILAKRIGLLFMHWNCDNPSCLLIVTGFSIEIFKLENTNNYYKLSPFVRDRFFENWIIFQRNMKWVCFVWPWMFLQLAWTI